MPVAIDHLPYGSEVLGSPSSISVCCDLCEDPEVDGGDPGYSHDLNSTHIAVVTGAFDFGSHCGRHICSP